MALLVVNKTNKVSVKLDVYSADTTLASIKLNAFYRAFTCKVVL